MHFDTIFQCLYLDFFLGLGPWIAEYIRNDHRVASISSGVCGKYKPNMYDNDVNARTIRPIWCSCGVYEEFASSFIHTYLSYVVGIRYVYLPSCVVTSISHHSQWRMSAVEKNHYLFRGELADHLGRQSFQIGDGLFSWHFDWWKMESWGSGF